jgi:hypothetical protein
MQGLPAGVNVNQFMQQQGQHSQFSQFNPMGAAATAGANSPQYMQPPSAYQGAGVPPVLPGQPGLKMQPHSQQQVSSAVLESFSNQPLAGYQCAREHCEENS